MAKKKTTTKPRQTTPSAAKAHSGEGTDALERMYDVREQVEAALLREARGESVPELPRLFGALGWSDQDVDRARARASWTAEKLDQAGSIDDLAAARERLKQAQEAADGASGRAAELRRQIEKLEAEVQKLERDRDAAADQVWKMEQARELLREPRRLPEHVRIEYQERARTLRQRYHPQVTQLARDAERAESEEERERLEQQRDELKAQWDRELVGVYQILDYYVAPEPDREGDSG